MAAPRTRDLVAQPTPVTLFRFSAVTWNPHRIHYDAPYAATEGYAGPLVHSHLHGAFLLEAALRSAPDGARLAEFSWQNRVPAEAGTRLTVTGESSTNADGSIEWLLREAKDDGTVCATARARFTTQEEDHG